MDSKMPRIIMVVVSRENWSDGRASTTTAARFAL
jgi:hypothetical protein